jgi:hypothetical protein
MCTKVVLLFQGSNNELQYVNVKALNEWDSRYVGTANDLFFGSVPTLLGIPSKVQLEIVTKRLV